MFGLGVYATVPSALTVAVPSFGAETIVTVPPAAAVSFARRSMVTGVSSGKVNESFAATTAPAGGGATVAWAGVTSNSVAPPALDTTRTLLGGAASAGMTTWPPARVWPKPPTVSVGEATVSLEVAETVSVRAPASYAACDTATRSVTFVWNRGGPPGPLGSPPPGALR